MTNKTHPVTPPNEVVAELAAASLAVTVDSTDPLAPVAALAPIDLNPQGMITNIEQDEEIYALHMAGHTLTNIAHHYTKLTGRRWTIDEVSEALTRAGQRGVVRTQQQLAYAAQLELDRMDAALKAIWPAVQDGNLQAMDRWLRLSAERRKMLGLDAPDIQVSLRLGNADGVDYSVLTSEELKTLQTLQRKAASAATQKVVRSKTP